MALTTGTRVGPYEILALLGAGGMGEVYKARDMRLDRTVALKVTAAKFSERMASEAHAVAALNHPNICALYDLGPNYLVMEYVEGVPVAPVDGARRLLDLAVQIADGLQAAHSAGIVHRDLKPDNILVTRGGAREDTRLRSGQGSGAAASRRGEVARRSRAVTGELHHLTHDLGPYTHA